MATTVQLPIEVQEAIRRHQKDTPLCFLFEHDNFQGNHLILVGPNIDLHADGWGEQVSSVIVHSGYFTFFEDIGFRWRHWPPVKLGTGYYGNVQAHGIMNDETSSVDASQT